MTLLGISYCGYIGGSQADAVSGIAVDGAGNAYVSGLADPEGLPVLVGPDLTFNGSIDAFLAKVQAEGSGLDYCGYIGDSAYDDGHGIAVGGAGSVYVSSMTDTRDFPVTVGPDLTNNGG